MAQRLRHVKAASERKACKSQQLPPPASQNMSSEETRLRRPQRLQGHTLTLLRKACKTPAPTKNKNMKKLEYFDTVSQVIFLNSSTDGSCHLIVSSRERCDIVQDHNPGKFDTRERVLGYSFRLRRD